MTEIDVFVCLAASDLGLQRPLGSKVQRFESMCKKLRPFPKFSQFAGPQWPICFQTIQENVKKPVKNPQKMKQVLQKSAQCEAVERGFLGQSRHEEVATESAHWHHSVDYRLLDPREDLLRRCLCTFDCSTNRKQD